MYAVRCKRTKVSFSFAAKRALLSLTLHFVKPGSRWIRSGAGCPIAIYCARLHAVVCTMCMHLCKETSSRGCLSCSSAFVFFGLFVRFKFVECSIDSGLGTYNLREKY